MLSSKIFGIHNLVVNDLIQMQSENIMCGCLDVNTWQ